MKMTMDPLFDGDDASDEELKINKDYANNYDTWRQKEELNKLKTKYGEDAINLKGSEDESSSSSDDEEDENELSKQFDKEFYKTLACLKKKDPSIYHEEVTFFNSTNQDQAKDNENAEESIGKSKKEKALTLRDYERKIITERNGELSESEDEDTFLQKKNLGNKQTYVEEQRRLKESFKTVLADDEEEEGNNFLQLKEKTEKEQEQEDTAYKEWLKGQRSTIDAKEEEELKPLREFWTDPNLDENEKFLRDYILNNKFLEKETSNDGVDYQHVAHDSDKDLSEDERNIEEQEEFEHKYNFRFEEPDQDFIKRYPRTMENSMRKKDTRRSEKRAEVRQRKEADKVRKQEELKQLKALKRKEIKEKIEKLKEITGNGDIRIEGIDLDADFNPAEHDRKMTEIFNDEYYSVPEDMKPEFPEIDGELGIESTWDNYDPENEEFVPDDENYQQPHCEDPEFNMDADYDPRANLEAELVESTKKKKRRRRSKFAELIAKEKPKFDPQQHPSYQEYFDQYYSLDYEDMIGDLPCRFKYRKVVPNDYGLSVEEILMADDKELNKWCSLKRALQYRPDHIELNDVRMYQQRANNETLKKKILKSLYSTEEPNEEHEMPNTSTNDTEQSEAGKKRKRRKKKKTSTVTENSSTTVSNENIVDDGKEKPSTSNNSESQSKAVKRKRPTEKSNEVKSEPEKSEDVSKDVSDQPPAKKSKKEKLIDKRERRKQNKKQNVVPKGVKQVVSMNAERLKTYGLNAKKFKNKLIYGNKKKQ